MNLQRSTGVVLAAVATAYSLSALAAVPVDDVVSTPEPGALALIAGAIAAAGALRALRRRK